MRIQVNRARRRPIYPAFIRGAHFNRGNFIIMDVVRALRTRLLAFIRATHLGVLCQRVCVVVIIQMILGNVSFVTRAILRDLSRIGM